MQSTKEISPVEIQMAAAAGVQLLAVKDLPVPMELAKTGNLGLLEGVLVSLSRGDVTVCNPNDMEELMRFRKEEAAQKEVKKDPAPTGPQSVVRPIDVPADPEDQQEIDQTPDEAG